MFDLARVLSPYFNRLIKDNAYFFCQHLLQNSFLQDLHLLLINHCLCNSALNLLVIVKG